jgi:hypothetical protein
VTFEGKLVGTPNSRGTGEIHHCIEARTNFSFHRGQGHLMANVAEDRLKGMFSSLESALQLEII